jgi:hypothetical protein
VPADDLVVTLHLWGVPRRHIPTAVTRMALDRARAASSAGLRFAKLLGTGDGTTFTVRDADLRHWAVLAVWDGEGAAGAFDRSRMARRWDDAVRRAAAGLRSGRSRAEGGGRAARRSAIRPRAGSTARSPR